MAADRKRIAELVHTARRQSGLTQQQLAEQAGLSVGTVSRIERGRVHAEFTTVLALAEAMGVSRAEAVRWMGDTVDTPAAPQPILSEAARSALHILSRLGQDDQARLLLMMKAYVDHADPEGSAKMFRDAAKG